jgi:hypothetical protein
MYRSPTREEVKPGEVKEKKFKEEKKKGQAASLRTAHMTRIPFSSSFGLLQLQPNNKSSFFRPLSPTITGTPAPVGCHPLPLAFSAGLSALASLLMHCARTPPPPTPPPDLFLFSSSSTTTSPGC